MPQTIVNEQPNKMAVRIEIIALLERLVMLYQIPNWSDKNGLLLSEWIMDNFKFETLETIKSVLKNPPKTKDQNWRLTPDTINAWFVFELERLAEVRERENQKLKESELRLALLPHDSSPNMTDEVNKLLDEYKASILKMEIKSVRPMTADEIRIEGGEDLDSYKKWKRDNGY